MPKIVGLTGGIASGKSTVAGILRDLGASVVDADQVAREVVEPGTPALAEIAERWGEDVLDDDGNLDRNALGDIVFGDDEQRAALNAITHPRIAQASQQKLAALAARGVAAVVYEAALIVENGLHTGGWMDGLIVVSVSPEVQRERLMRRDQISAADAAARLAAQLPLADKIAAADYVIDNSGSMEETRVQVEATWSEIRAA